ncbi:hypothetical protein DAPPUDRAFT_253318 [Daphnia pulex]|uniref:Uncharacterized protein n=1 Tax=Daphnia pulex TaxID=6669 RepID=E9H4J8_DAPPU|nr:hypothetical protein DAPPUDRAFT_253318 [Daphnia pulex]|eukprot:EFX73335.1 hypothetical protein DAPPUDRAFT_253318 [Daphnia pulex]
MGQKQSSSEVADSEMAMTNRTDLSSQFTNVMRSYQTDECFNCGAALEDSNLYNSSTNSSRTPKSSTEVTVRCRQCRVCDSTNVILEKFRTVITSPRSIPIVSSAHNESNQFSQTNHHLMRTNSSLDTPNNATSTFTESSSTCV